MQGLNSSLQVAQAEMLQLEHYDWSQPAPGGTPVDIMQAQLREQMQGLKSKVLSCSSCQF